MVPSHRQFGFAEVDPALNPRGAKGVAIHRAGALFPEWMGLLESLSSRRWETLETKSWPGEPRPTLPHWCGDREGHRPRRSKGQGGLAIGAWEFYLIVLLVYLGTDLL